MTTIYHDSTSDIIIEEISLTTIFVKQFASPRVTHDLKFTVVILVRVKKLMLYSVKATSLCCIAFCPPRFNESIVFGLVYCNTETRRLHGSDCSLAL